MERDIDRQELGLDRLKGFFKEIDNDAHRSLAGKHSKAVVELRGSGSFEEALGRITRVLQAHCTRIWLRQLPMTYVQATPFVFALHKLCEPDRSAFPLTPTLS